MDVSYYKRKFLRLTPPRELAAQLLSKAADHIKKADRAILEKDYESANRSLITVQNIFLELAGAVLSQGSHGEKAGMLLEEIAGYVMLANVNADREMLREALEITVRLGENYAFLLHPY